MRPTRPRRTHLYTPPRDTGFVIIRPPNAPARYASTRQCRNPHPARLRQPAQAALNLPSAAIVEVVVAHADVELALRNFALLIAAAELRRAATLRVLVRTAPTRHLRHRVRHPAKYSVKTRHARPVSLFIDALFFRHIQQPCIIASLIVLCEIAGIKRCAQRAVIEPPPNPKPRCAPTLCVSEFVANNRHTRRAAVEPPPNPKPRLRPHARLNGARAEPP